MIGGGQRILMTIMIVVAGRGVVAALSDDNPGDDAGRYSCRPVRHNTTGRFDSPIRRRVGRSRRCSLTPTRRPGIGRVREYPRLVRL